MHHHVHAHHGTLLLKLMTWQRADLHCVAAGVLRCLEAVDGDRLLLSRRGCKSYQLTRQGRERGAAAQVLLDRMYRLVISHDVVLLL